MTGDWFILGVLAFGFAVLNLIRTWLGRRTGWQKLLFLSLSCGAFALLGEYRAVYDWVVRRDWSALADVVPGLFGVLSVCVFVGVALNAVVLVWNTKREKDS